MQGFEGTVKKWQQDQLAAWEKQSEQTRTIAAAQLARVAQERDSVRAELERLLGATMQ
jgi:ribosomal protein L3